MALLEESGAGPDLVGNAPPRQLDLELQRLVVRPVENGEVGELLSLVVPLQQALADEAGLVGDVRQRDDGREPPGLAGGRELLGKLLLVVGDRGVGERQDLGRRTIVARQPERLRLRVALREAEDVLERGAAERVDRLRVVADDRDVLLDARHPVDDLSLQTVGVLVLVDEDVIVRSTELRGRLRHLVEQPLPHQQEVVVVTGVAEPLALAVALEDRDDLRLELGEVGRVLGEDLGERPARVDRERVEVEQDVALREAPLERRDFAVGGRGLEHLAGVLGVEDREVGAEPQPRPEPAQDPVPDGVESPAHEAAGVDGQQRLDPAEHLLRGLVGEGQEQDARGIEARTRSAARRDRRGCASSRSPAPAITRIGPPSARTTSRCSSFKSRS